jgi:hypothetical protein
MVLHPCPNGWENRHPRCRAGKRFCSCKVQTVVVRGTASLSTGCNARVIGARTLGQPAAPRQTRKQGCGWTAPSSTSGRRPAPRRCRRRSHSAAGLSAAARLDHGVRAARLSRRCCAGFTRRPSVVEAAQDLLPALAELQHGLVATDQRVGRTDPKKQPDSGVSARFWRDAVSERSLVVHFGSLDALVSAMQATPTRSSRRCTSTLQRVDARDLRLGARHGISGGAEGLSAQAGAGVDHCVRRLRRCACRWRRCALTLTTPRSATSP